MGLPTPPTQLPRTQADWERFLNVMQGWQNSLTVLTWQAPTLGADVANYGSGWQTAGFAKDVSGRVWLRGLITGSGITLGTTLFTLPSGYRPTANEMFAARADTGTETTCRLNVQSNGIIAAIASDSGTDPTTFLSLSGVSFQTT